MSALSPAVARLLAVTLLVVAVGAIWVLAVEPVTTRYKAYESDIAESQEDLAYHRRIAAERDQLEARLETLRRAQAASGSFLEGGSIELVAAEVQNKVKALIDSHGASLKSMQALASEEVDGFRKVTVRVNMTGDTQAFQEIFYAVETANPYLFLDNIDVRSRRPRARRGRPPPQSDLQIRFDVSGYMRSEAP